MREWVKKTLKTSIIVAVVAFIILLLAGLVISFGKLTNEFITADLVFSLALGLIIFLLNWANQAAGKKK